MNVRKALAAAALSIITALPAAALQRKVPLHLFYDDATAVNLCGAERSCDLLRDRFIAIVDRVNSEWHRQVPERNEEFTIAGIDYLPSDIEEDDCEYFMNIARLHNQDHPEEHNVYFIGHKITNYSSPSGTLEGVTRRHDTTSVVRSDDLRTLDYQASIVLHEEGHKVITIDLRTTPGSSLYAMIDENRMEPNMSIDAGNRYLLETTERDENAQLEKFVQAKKYFPDIFPLVQDALLYTPLSSNKKYVKRKNAALAAAGTVREGLEEFFSLHEHAGLEGLSVSLGPSSATVYEEADKAITAQNPLYAISLLHVAESKETDPDFLFVIKAAMVVATKMRFEEILRPQPLNLKIGYVPFVVHNTDKQPLLGTVCNSILCGEVVPR